MPYLEEFKLVLIVIAIVLVYMLIIRPKLHSRKQKILERYLLVQSFSLNMQDLLLNYILQNDAMSKDLMPGVTFKSYLRDLQKKHSLYLSDKKYKKIKGNILLLFGIWIGQVLDKQEERLKKVQKDLSILQDDLSRNTQHREAIAN